MKTLFANKCRTVGLPSYRSSCRLAFLGSGTQPISGAILSDSTCPAGISRRVVALERVDTSFLWLNIWFNDVQSPLKFVEPTTHIHIVLQYISHHLAIFSQCFSLFFSIMDLIVIGLVSTFSLFHTISKSFPRTTYL